MASALKIKCPTLHFIILFGYLMLFAELKNILQYNNKELSGSRSNEVVASLLCNIVPHDLALKIIFPCP